MALKTDPEGVIIGVSGPASDGAPVTPSDATDVEFRALWVGTGGNVSVIFFNGSSTVTLTNVPDGTLLPIMVRKVMAATTASGIVGLS